MLYTKTQFLMGTDISITVNALLNPMDDIHDAFAIFYSLEKEFSRFDNNSELSILNKSREKEVSNRFLDILKKSLEFYVDTNHYFNPLVNISNLGYSADFLKSVFESTEVEQNLEFEKIVILGNFVSLQENQNLDFGGIVKGYSVDLCSNFLLDKGYKDFIINAGGDIFISGNNQKGKTPVVAIDSPFNSDDIFALLELKDKSISTSGTYKRKWTIKNNDFHHILDPITNENNNEIVSVSVIHDKCYITDVYATTCIAMGIKKSLEFLNKRNVDGVIIGSDGKVYKTEGMNSYNFEII